MAAQVVATVSTALAQTWVLIPAILALLFRTIGATLPLLIAIPLFGRAGVEGPARDA